MTTVRPSINLDTGMLTVSVHNRSDIKPLQIPLSAKPADLKNLHPSASRVCGDKITALTYNDPEIVDFFSTAVGVPCTLARFPAESTSRNYKPHLAKNGAAAGSNGRRKPNILLSNESPILVINKSSVDALNQHIASTNGKQAKPDVFRANIVLRNVAEEDEPYAEDTWRRLKIGSEHFDVSGPRRYRI
jgi:molybdenum cofactor sulfurtransferase